MFVVVDRVNLRVEAIAKQRSVDVVLVLCVKFSVIACKMFGLSLSFSQFS